MSKLLIFTDGGSRGNPGPAAIGVFVQDDAQATVYELGRYLGIGTNNEAEYEAIVASLTWLTAYLPEHAEVEAVKWQLDSKLVVEQLQKHWKIKEDRLRAKAQQCWELMNGLKLPYSIVHVPRELNHEADRLVNEALDAQAATSS